MDKTRLWIIGSVLVMAVIATLGWIVGIQPQLDQASAAGVETAQVQSGNAVKQTVLAKMKKDSENLATLKKKLTSLKTSVPTLEEWPAFGDEINSMAAANGVAIVSVTTSDGQAYTTPVAPAAAPAPGAASGSSPAATSTPTPSPSSSPTPTPAPVKVVGAPPLNSPLITSSNFTLVPVSVTVRGSVDQIVAFVHSAQTGVRLFLVNALTIDNASAGVGLDGKVSGYIYVLNKASEVNTAK